MMTIPTQLILNPTAPDFLGIYQTLEADLLAAPSGSWNDLAIAGTGSTLMRWIASVGAFSQGSIARAIQEDYLDTARSPSGVYRAVRLQGARLIRRRPGQIQVSVVRTDAVAAPLVIPTLQQWSVGGQNFYNSSPITLSTTGAAVTVTLNRGVVNTQTFTSTGTAYQLYVLGTSGAWNVSNTDVWMTDSSNNVWTASSQGLWKATNGALIFYEATLPDGTSECKFGDGTYGVIPPAGTLTFTFVTLDTEANTTLSPTIGTAGTCRGYTVTATSTSTASANLDAPSPDFYKSVGPGQAANNARAVTRDDHRALALAYPGVIDAIFRGQAELNPSDLRYMNVIATTLLTTTPWTETQWLTFKTYMEGSVGIATTVFIRSDPVAVPINITLTAAAATNASITSLQTLITQVVNTFFTPVVGALGRSLAPSDLPLDIMESATYLQAPGESGALLDYVYQNAPSTQVTLAPWQYATLGTFTLNLNYTTRGVNAASAGLIVGM